MQGHQYIINQNVSALLSALCGIGALRIPNQAPQRPLASDPAILEEETTGQLCPAIHRAEP